MAFTNLVKKINAQSIINRMSDGRAHTKQELARLEDLSFPTVGKIVEELAEKKMLVRLGTGAESQGGRKAEVYKLNEDFAHMILLYLQGQSVFYWICDALGTVKTGGEKRGRKGQLPFSLLQECVREIMASDENIGAIAAGLPGSIYNGTVYCMDGYADMCGRNVERELYETAGVPVSVSNNMNIVAIGLAERRAQGRRKQGGGDGQPGGKLPPGEKGKEADTTVCIHLTDTGPGLGAVVNGRALCGFCGFQGEVGFMPLYGEKTIQDMAMDGFREVPPGECLGKMAACVCTVLNPRQIICYLELEQKEDWGKSVEQEMIEYCNRYLPAYAHPQFVFDRDYKKDYLYGLITVGKRLLYQWENIG